MKFPDVCVQLTGRDGNVFSIIANVTRALKKAGEAQAADQFAKDAMSCDSYDAVLRLCMQTVDVQ